MKMRRTKYLISTTCLALGVATLFACRSKTPTPNRLNEPPHILPIPTPPAVDPDPEPGPAPEPTEARRQTVEYMKLQLDQNLVQRPPSFLYGQEVKVQDLAQVKQDMWTLWREANTERLERSGLMNLGAEQRDLLWDIPEGQRMKAKLIPKGEKPEQGYPLFINLHGGGKADVQDPWGSALNDLAWDAEINRSLSYQDMPSVHFVPRMADDRIGRWYLAPQRNAFRRIYQLGVLSGLIDPERAYILGTSEGGYGSHRLALFMPDFFAGAGPMAAAEPLYAAENVRNIAFGLQMGENDRGFRRSEFAHLWQDKLAELQSKSPNDYVHRIEIEPDRGHGDIDFAVMTPWLRQHQRRTYPQRLSFLYYNMTRDYAAESYAQMMYYLDFRKLKHSKDAAMRFDVTHSGNDYHITNRLESGAKIWGELGIYLHEGIDYTKPVRVVLNDKEVFNAKVLPNRGVMVESIALWGDPTRIYPAKLSIAIL